MSRNHNININKTINFSNMIENILIRKQTPSDGKYLYRFDEQSNRYFISTCAYLGKEDTEWDECTEDEKNAYEKHNEEHDTIERERNEKVE